MKCLFISNRRRHLKSTGVCWEPLVCYESEAWKRHLLQRQADASVGRKMSHITLNNNAAKIIHGDGRIAVTFPENIMMYSALRLQQQTLITSRSKHVAHLMKVGHKCNKAAKVIRSATGHFTAAHTPRIGLWREIWWTKEVELAHLQRTRGGLMACDWIHSYSLIPLAMTVCSGLSQACENSEASFKGMLQSTCLSSSAIRFLCTTYTLHWKTSIALLTYSFFSHSSELISFWSDQEQHRKVFI